MSEQFADLVNESKCINDGTFGYKLLVDTNATSGDPNYIAKLQILGQTNESRKNVINPNFAKFRTDKVYVVWIKNVETGKQINSLHSKYRDIILPINTKEDMKYGPFTTYTVDQQVIVSDYNTDPYIIYGKGIGYYKTYEAAFHSISPEKCSYKGIWKSFSDDGLIFTF